jgi:hypothetical protein
VILGELIEALEKLPEDRVLAVGFDKPHSYRGYYNGLAFEPARNIPVKKMLEAARSAPGNWYQGYKGGTYYMDAGTPRSRRWLPIRRRRTSGHALIASSMRW